MIAGARIRVEPNSEPFLLAGFVGTVNSIDGENAYVIFDGQEAAGARRVAKPDLVVLESPENAEHTEATSIAYNDLANYLRQHGVEGVYDNHSGGGVATLYAGRTNWKPGMGWVSTVAIGPGWYEGPGWTNGRVSVDDLWYGSEDEEESFKFSGSPDIETIGAKILEFIRTKEANPAKYAWKKVEAPVPPAEGERFTIDRDGLEPTVNAKAHSDDHLIEIDFDATRWFACATDTELLALRAIKYGGDMESDAVADFFRPDATKKLFDYLALEPRHTLGRDPVGFGCHIDVDEAEAWIDKNRPHLSLNDEIKAASAKRHDERYCTSGRCIDYRTCPYLSDEDKEYSKRSETVMSAHELVIYGVPSGRYVYELRPDDDAPYGFTTSPTGKANWRLFGDSSSESFDGLPLYNAKEALIAHIEAESQP